MKKLFIYIDGASKGNPGKAGYGFLIYDEKKNLVEKSGGFLGITTNNVAEYFALIFSLISAIKYNPESIIVYSDSQLMVKQINGEYKVKQEWIKRLYAVSKSLIGNFKKISIVYIPREENKEADNLANSFVEKQNSLF